MLLDVSRLNIVIEDSCVSWSGKYFGFYGIHYEAGQPCWVVGALDKSNGKITKQHYNIKTGCINEDAAKYAARKAWQKFKEGLIKAPVSQETDDDTSLVSQWIDEYERQSKRIDRKRLN